MFDEWKPIQSVSMYLKDDVLLYCADTREMFVGYRKNGEWCYALWEDGTPIVCRPSHWKSLPKPPEAEQERRSPEDQS